MVILRDFGGFFQDDQNFVFSQVKLYKKDPKEQTNNPAPSFDMCYFFDRMLLS